MVDGPEEVRRATRNNLRKGAKHIKLMLSGGVTSPTDSVYSTQFSLEEIAMAVKEAEAQGVYVTGHAYIASAISEALDLGLKCIEHGNLLDEETIAKFLEKDASLVPTLVTYAMMDKYGLQEGLSKSSWTKNRQVLERMHQGHKNG